MSSESRMYSVPARVRHSIRWRTLPFRNWVYATATGLWRSRQRTWRRNLSEEISFWEEYIRDRGGRFSEDFAFRMSTESPLQDHLAQYLPDEHARILDVGAGPLTCIGKVWKGRRLDITPVDPLAGEYQKIFDKYRLEQPIPTKPAEAESLSRVFAPCSFDFAHARNCLDHSFDPPRAIEEMLKVVKAGCVVYLWHFENEGKNEGYEGLHRWNFKDGTGILSFPVRDVFRSTSRRG